MKTTLTTLLLLFTLLVGCSDSNEMTIITNVKGYTISGDSVKTFTTIVINNGKVQQIGDESILEAQYNAEVIDGEGKTMLPGIIDAHAHVMNLGFQELQINLMGINSLEATLDSIKSYAEANPELEWILGRGWNQTIWEENEFPTAADLDKVVSDRPIWLDRVDGHAGWGNTRAMEIAGISKDTPDSQGGRIVRNEQGDATGVFIDASENYVTQHIPNPTDQERELAFTKALEEMARLGITSVHDARITEKDWAMYTKFADSGKLLTRIYAMIGGTGQIFDNLAKNGPINSYADDMLSMRSVKISEDGALGSRGAAMIEPYSDDPGNVGLLFYTQEELDAMVEKGMSQGFQMNIHAIGDRANRVVLNSLERAQEITGRTDLRNRIEHAQIVALEDIPRFAELDLIASMQPTHATSDKNMAEDRVGSERIKGGYAWRTFLDQGTVIASGSDFPVEQVNPFYGLYSAETRMDFEGRPLGGWYPEQALTRTEALRSFTVDAAYAAHQEEVLGKLESGYWADFILIDRDYFEMDASEIWKIKVLETWVAGKKVYATE